MRRQQGFTLVELLVVLAIVGAVLAVALPSLSMGPGRRDLLNAAHDIAATLREARSQALIANHSRYFHADLSTNSFWAQGEARNMLPPGLAMSVRTAEEQILEGSATIRFYPDGSSSGGGITLAVRDVAYDILVDWLDGGITIREQVERAN
ncbi:GspH/FimT family pseudopilin [Indioceanicola profundi]|uniref:GspH/FimT family pseudopilin n=1 Tax=Indioceanicola profundi TaxID=2220096 RepID=UPI000E6ABD80|nr:GspH/FimT family pseudopilin [Indioceanicola profundi]